MANRRPRGDGNIRQRTDGTWEVRVDFGWKDGKRQRRSVYGKTKADVLAKKRQLERSRDDGAPVPSQRQTFAAYATYWLENHVKPPMREYKTYRTYSDLLRLHVTPTLGKTPLARLTAQEVQSLYSQLVAGSANKKALSPQTVNHIHAVIHRMLAVALRQEAVNRNVADLVTPIPAPHKERPLLTPEQVAKLLVAARGQRLEALYVLAVHTGMRQGELLGLHWSDVDFEERMIVVRGSLKRAAKGEPLTVGSTKTKKTRQFPLTHTALEALEVHRERQTAERLLAPAWESNDLVFANEVGRPIEATHVLRRSFKPLLAKAELPAVHFHDLRHSAATFMLSSGTNYKDVSAMLGHSRIGTTFDLYAHAMPSAQRTVVDALDALLTEASGALQR